MLMYFTQYYLKLCTEVGMGTSPQESSSDINFPSNENDFKDKIKEDQKTHIESLNNYF